MARVSSSFASHKTAARGSCGYCHFEGDKHLVLCWRCKPPKYYCNSRHCTVASHIVDHIYRARHFDKLQYDDRDLRCSKCGYGNILRLLIAKDKHIPTKAMDQVLCKRCADKEKSLDFNFVIENHALLEELVPYSMSSPTNACIDLRRQILLSRWSDDDDEVPLKFQSPNDYCGIFKPLLQMEMQKSYGAKSAMRQEVEVGPKQSTRWIIKLDAQKERPRDGDHAFLESKGLAQAVPITIKITHCPHSGEKVIAFEIYDSEKQALRSGTYTLDFKPHQESWSRQLRALKRFLAAECVDSTFQKYLLGQREFGWKYSKSELQSVRLLPQSPWLNERQKEAIKLGLDERIALIHGPPGTGKTLTLITLVFNLVTQGQKVLVCAPSNTATNSIRLLLQEYDVQVCKSPEDLQAAAKWDVVCCTCSGGQKDWHSAMQGMDFGTVVIDEAAQATEPECLIPITKGCKKMILFGDDKQLGPTVNHKEAKIMGLDNSMFKRLRLLKAPDVLLNQQYRMDPQIWAAVSKPFYRGEVHSIKKNRSQFSWPQTGRPIMFWTCKGDETCYHTSFYNKKEIERVQKVIDWLFKKGIDRRRISVITFYDAQREEIKRALSLKGTNIRVDNVDGFQGSEAEYIIISCVRSNPEREIGFLNDRRRVNVALTRAKCSLVVIGDEFTLKEAKAEEAGEAGSRKKSNPWTELLTEWEEFTYRGERL